jgi:hypothetical protein
VSFAILCITKADGSHVPCGMLCCLLPSVSAISAPQYASLHWLFQVGCVSAHGGERSRLSSAFSFSATVPESQSPFSPFRGMGAGSVLDLQMETAVRAVQSVRAAGLLWFVEPLFLRSAAISAIPLFIYAFSLLQVGTIRKVGVVPTLGVLRCVPS